MAKLKSDAIKPEDMQEYLNSSSDFAFEMKVLKLLNDKGLETTFGGLYQDPNTNQTRQFDIRSKIILDSKKTKHSLWLAIECKNLRANFPLLISGSKRKSNESFIDTWQYTELKTIETFGATTSYLSHGHYASSQILQPANFYMSDSFVGRSCAQVGRNQNNQLESSDTEVYNKWTQSLCSLYGLMQITLADMKRGFAPGIFAFIPIVVVSDGMLWIAEYSDSGELLVKPKQVEKCSYWVSKRYTCPTSAQPSKYTVSHIEFMTFSGLKDFLTDDAIHQNIFQKG